MISVKIKFIDILFLLVCLVLAIPLYALGTLEDQDVTSTRKQRELDIGTQKFDFTSPKSGLEQGESGVGGSFPKVVLDKPVNPDDYILGVGDRLVLIGLGKVNSNIMLTIGPEGRIILPDFGSVKIAGKTLSQAEEKISLKMKTKYPRLEFHLLLAEPRAFKAYVLGEVNSPGVHVLTALDRVADAIQKAGGIKVSGTKRNIEIRRKEKVIHADMYLFFEKGDVKSNPPVLENDIIFVPPSQPRVTIGGGVRKAGVYELEKNEDIRHFIERIGGLANRVTYGKPVKIVRFTGKNRKKVIKLDLNRIMNGEDKSLLLEDGDTVVVPSIDEVPSNESSVYVTGEVKKPGAYPFVPGYTAKSYIGIAGGLTSRARYSQTEIIKTDGTRVLLSDDTVLELGDTINVPEKFIKVWQDCLVITTSISSLTLAVIAALK